MCVYMCIVTFTYMDEYIKTHLLICRHIDELTHIIYVYLYINSITYVPKFHVYFVLNHVDWDTF